MPGEVRRREVEASRRRWATGASRPVFLLVEDYQWVHLGIGILGNCLFLTGSFLFMSESTKGVAVYFFIAGSTGMLIGSVGSAIVKLARRRRPEL
ncbi:MAG: YrhK family protein [Geminicoccaceae bacterium]|nr:YrhK family protein [Geminicoccaceae bacterium]